MFAIYVRI